MTQSTMDEFTQKKIWDINHLNARKIHLKIIKFMALDNQPFSVVEDQGFIELVAQLEPHYLIPSRTYFSETKLPGVYNELRATVNERTCCCTPCLVCNRYLDQFTQQRFFFVNDSTLGY